MRTSRALQLCVELLGNIWIRVINQVMIILVTLSHAYTAIQGVDSGRVAAREFNRMSVHPNFVRFLLTKSWVDRFHTNDLTIPAWWFRCARGNPWTIIACARSILNETEQHTVYAHNDYRMMLWLRLFRNYNAHFTCVKYEGIQSVVYSDNKLEQNL